MPLLPRLLCAVFGPNWKTSVCGAVCLVSGFVAASPEFFTHWPLIVALAKYIAVGSGAAGLRLAHDVQKPKS
jgi:hypothetical protein